MDAQARLLGPADIMEMLAIPAVASMPEFMGVRELARRMQGRRGCAGCHKLRARPEWLAPSVGAALQRVLRHDGEARLYTALATHYNIAGPVQLAIGPCRVILGRQACNTGSSSRPG